MADYKFLQHIDGAWRQLKRWVMYKYSGTPSDAQEGSFWYDTVTKTPKYHNGTTAKDIGKYVVAGTGTTVSASGNDLAVNVTYGTVANSSCVGNDSRLSDARTPISHAVSATTYGVGTSSNYGHVKLYTSIGNNTDGSPTNSAVSGALALKANVSQLSDGSVTKVGTASVGSTTVPVYVNAGTLTACSGTLGVSITGNANTATTATKLGSSTVGSASQPIYLNAGVATAITGTIGNSTTGNAATATKLGTSTVGSTNRPIYLNAGVPSSLSDTVGDNRRPVFLNAGALTPISDTVGSSDIPVYSDNGTLTACNQYFKANLGKYGAVETVGSKGNYTGISAPGALRLDFMSRTDTRNAGLYCETDSKWVVLRNTDGTLRTDYSPELYSNTTEIATTAFVNSKLNQYEFNWYNSSSSYGNWLTKVASWTPAGGTSYEIAFDLDFIGSDFPWNNTAFSATIGYSDGTWSYNSTMKGQHDGFSRFYIGVNSGVCEIWLYTYGSYPRAIGRMTSQTHQFMYNPTGTWTQTIASYLTSSSWAKNVMVGDYSATPIIIQVQSLATARTNSQTIYFCT